MIKDKEMGGDKAGLEAAGGMEQAEKKTERKTIEVDERS